jgi:hypothetical protein
MHVSNRESIRHSIAFSDFAIFEDNFRFWWRRVHEGASQGMYMSKIEICFITARILQNKLANLLMHSQ